jgi:hypothetical protein
MLNLPDLLAHKLMYQRLISGNASFSGLVYVLHEIADRLDRAGKNLAAGYLHQLSDEMSALISLRVSRSPSELSALVAREARLMRGQTEFLELAHELASLVPLFASAGEVSVAQFFSYLTSDMVACVHSWRMNDSCTPLQKRVLATYSRSASSETLKQADSLHRLKVALATLEIFESVEVESGKKPRYVPFSADMIKMPACRPAQAPSDVGLPGPVVWTA